MSRAYISPPRFALLTLVVLGCFAALFARLAYLHVFDSDRLTRLAFENRQKLDVLNARRGDIVDQRGNIIATTRSLIEVGVDPQVARPGDEEKLPALAQLLGVPLPEVEATFGRKVRLVESPEGPEHQLVRWTRLHEGLEEAIYAQVRALDIKGVYGNRRYLRVYPGGERAAHLLGFVNKEGAPAMGVEAYLDFYLRGQNGWRETEQDGRHRELAQFRARDVPATPGLNVELTLDLMLQFYAEEELKRIAQEYQPQGATIIIGDPATGEILALANYPTFDPNRFWDFPLDSLRNRAVSDTFEPGSTFKVVTAAGALNEGLVRPSDMIDCDAPTIAYGGRQLRLPGDHDPLGVLSVAEVVAQSSNRGAAHLGVRLGAQRLYNYARAFGFGEATGFGLGGEVKGTLHPVSQWDGLTITRLPMGHAVSATALQVHGAMAAIANRGVLMEPRLVRRVFDAEGRTVMQFPPLAKRRVISSDTARILNQMLCAVVGPDGTASRAKLQDITVAGKTGTTQKIVDGRYSNQHHVATFSGYFPAERPRLVITVVVDDARMRGTAYGGVVAAPAFHNVAQLAVQYLGIQPVTGGSSLLAMQGGRLDWVHSP